MNIKSINEYVKFDNERDIYNLFDSTFFYDDTVNFEYFEVLEEHEMRIDLLFRDMYNMESNEVGLYLENIDIILYINSIDNALNIVKGDILKYPPNLEDFDKFRITVDDSGDGIKAAKDKLVVPNKATRKDSDREKFKNNNYSLPPVVLDRPRPPVRIENGRFSVGGL